MSLSLTKGSQVVDLGEVDVTDGIAPVEFVAPAVGEWTLVATAEPSGTEVQVPVRVAKADAKITSIRVTPKKVIAQKTKAGVTVRVRSAGDFANGKVQIKAAGKTYTQKLRDGVARFTLKRFKKPGKATLRVTYLGDDATTMARDSVSFRVVKKNKKK
ncbi:Ig-like domain repeat protein [Nocardioides sambongensis]|uniref:Ig-like domain repeat protein n=1 Tax=Nocardioides sambongensis TaxID=2589074 RepID=UPI001129AA32|nr:Ig-like domain repeat protein [Nocardioides sambongensis]